MLKKAFSAKYCRPFLCIVHKLFTFSETWQEPFLGVGDSKLFKWYLWPPWGPWGGPPRAKTCKFQTSSSLDPEVEQSSYVVCRYLLIGEK